MKATKMRLKGRKTLTAAQMQRLITSLKRELKRAGFITEVFTINRSSLQIGLRGKSFTVDTSIHGYNAIMGIHVNSKKGYKRTTIPVWNQRVTFNHIVNDCFDALKVDAAIRSGIFTVRDCVTGRIHEWRSFNFLGQLCDPDTSINGLGQVVDLRMTEKEAILLTKGLT